MTAGQIIAAERLAVFALVAAVVGSFLNVCIYRIPLGKSVVHPRSSCPACGHTIRAWHNVPVASWVLLRGRCADCHAPISARYPFVELANTGLWLWAWFRFGPSAGTLLLAPFLSAMLALFFTDWDHQLLPDRITLPAAALGLATAWWNPRLDPVSAMLFERWPAGRIGASVAGALLGYGLFYVIWLAWKILFKRDSMGGGDLKLMLAVGAFLGVPGVLLTILFGSVVGTLVSIPFLLAGRWNLKRELPFGCFLTPAAVFAALYGREALIWYLETLFP